MAASRRSIRGHQVAFSIFIALETWLTPIEGWIVDLLGARRWSMIMVAFGGINPCAAATSSVIPCAN
jgi:hypothetical protein